MSNPYTIGADPELFLKRGNNFISAEDKYGPIIPGTKKKPFEVKGGAIQVDGVATEFNIDPAKNFEEFYRNIRLVVSDLRTRVQKHDNQIGLKPIPTAVFDKEYFFSLPKHTLELGCEPDYNAYKDAAPNPRPQTTEPFRTGSGHIHIGWTNGVDPKSLGHLKDCCLVTQTLDKYLLFASKDWDTDEKRRTLYGAAGSFRPKSFGVEYRPLSNAWLNSPRTIQAVYYITLGVMRGLETGTFDINYSPTERLVGENHTQKVLNKLHRYIPEVFK